MNIKKQARQIYRCADIHANESFFFGEGTLASLLFNIHTTEKWSKSYMNICPYYTWSFFQPALPRYTPDLLLFALCGQLLQSSLILIFLVGHSVDNPHAIVYAAHWRPNHDWVSKQTRSLAATNENLTSSLNNVRTRFSFNTTYKPS